MSDYTIVEPAEVSKILELLKPYVRLKIKHVGLGIEILKRLERVTSADDFLAICQKVDCFKGLNYSKKRTITSENVKMFLKQHNYLTPVETASFVKRVP
jgi:hypothetical protein